MTDLSCRSEDVLAAPAMAEPWGWRCRLVVCGHRRHFQPHSVLPCLPGRLPVCPGYCPRLLRGADDVPPDGRRLGLPDPAGPRSRHAAHCRCWPCFLFPIACGVGYLYLWTQPEAVAVHARPAAQADLSQRPLLLGSGRSSYFILWIGLAYFLNLWSRQQDQTDDPRGRPGPGGEKLGMPSGPGLIIFGITITFAVG